MPNAVTLAFKGDTNDLNSAASKAANSTKQVGNAAQDAGKEAKKGFDTATFSAVGLADSIGNASDVVDSINGVFRAGSNNASRLARAQNDLEQSALDATQAQEDLKQSARDGAQAAIDMEQAQLDAAQAQKDHTAAVKEFGAGSIEAKQALIDQKQAQEDYKQAQRDSNQAVIDAKQAAIDATGAQLDMSDAQTELTDASGWRGWLSTVAEAGPALLAVSTAYSAVRAHANLAALASARHNVATVAGTVATKGMAAAQAALNLVMKANPIVRIIAIVTAFGAAIALAWRKSETFRDVVTTVWRAIRSAASATWEFLKGVFNWFVKLPERIGRALGSLGGFIGRAFKGAVNVAIDALNWGIRRINNLIDGINWINPFEDIPHINQIPRLHRGGTVPGSPGENVLINAQAGEKVTARGQSNERTVYVDLGAEIMRMIRRAVKAEGGDVQIVLGSGT